MKPVSAHPGRLLKELGLSPRKSLGQTFLHDRNVARKIVSQAVSMGPPFLEIGPGLGALTDLLVEEGHRVTAVEVDRGLAAYLRGRYADPRVEVVETDFLAMTDEELEGRFPEGGTVVGNLPYSISSPLVLRLMEMRETFPRAVLMLQKEVVERLCAPPGGKAYGILSVYMSALASAREEFNVKRTCFTPPPDVDSAVISVRFRPGIPGETVRRLQEIVRAAFARRRKTLRNAPVAFLRGGEDEWNELLAGAGVDPSSRAETVPPDTYLAMARMMEKSSPPGSGHLDS